MRQKADTNQWPRNFGGLKGTIGFWSEPFPKKGKKTAVEISSGFAGPHRNRFGGSRGPRVFSSRGTPLPHRKRRPCPPITRRRANAREWNATAGPPFSAAERVIRKRPGGGGHLRHRGGKAALQVGPHAQGPLHGQLEGGPQHGPREERRRAGGQPQAEAVLHRKAGGPQGGHGPLQVCGGGGLATHGEHGRHLKVPQPSQPGVVPPPRSGP